MSKNLSEETPGKVVAAQGYGVRQLFRRPAPTSSERDLSWATRRTQSLSPQIPGDFTFTTVPMDSGAVSPSQSDISLITDGISVDEPGMYLVSWRIQWYSDIPTSETISSLLPSPAGSTLFESEMLPPRDQSVYALRNMNCVPVHLTVATTFKVQAAQNDGVDREAIAYLQVVRLGSSSGSGWMA